MLRSSGVVLPLFALPGPYGIGGFGPEAVHFARTLKAAGFSYWQILPQGPTGYGDSPYQSFSTFAGNPYFIDLRALAEDGLLSRSELVEAEHTFQLEVEGSTRSAVDYGHLWEKRPALLRLAFQRTTSRHREAEAAFLETEDWPGHYALYMAIKEAEKHRPWWEWPKPLRLQEQDALEAFAKTHREAIAFHVFLQTVFFEQWLALKKKINAEGVNLIGDVPIYVATDSADVWSNRQLFELGADGLPLRVAAVPPDDYTPDGQLWGNPLYDWEKNREEGYRWWLARLASAVRDCDLVRLDHFRGFEAFYAVPAGETTARSGVWEKGPGMDLFEPILRTFPTAPFLVEDLGFITDEVRVFHEATGLPGMQVMQFSFNVDDGQVSRPHDYPRNLAAYASTHDSDTLLGWVQGLDLDSWQLVRDYSGVTDQDRNTRGPRSEVGRALQRVLWQSPADLVLVQLADILGLDNSYRTNIPGTASGNWNVRYSKTLLNQFDVDYYARLNRVFQRSPLV